MLKYKILIKLYVLICVLIYFVCGYNIQAEVVGLLLASCTSLKMTTNRWPKAVAGYVVYGKINLHICICGRTSKNDCRPNFTVVRSPLL